MSGVDLGQIHHAGVAPIDWFVGLVALLVPEVEREVAQREDVADHLLAAQRDGTLVDVDMQQVIDRPLPAVTRWESPPAIGAIPMPALANTTGDRRHRARHRSLA